MAPSNPSRARGWWGLAAVVACLLLIGLDTTTTFLALPELMAALPASAGQLEAVFVAYLLTFGLLMLPLAALADRLGRRRILLAGLTILGLGAVGAASATDVSALIVARAGMGLGAAAIMPTALAMIPELFPPPERARAIAVASAAVSLGLCLGPLVAGGLLEVAWWGAVFLVDVPIVLVAVGLVAAVLPAARGALPGSTPADRVVARPSRPVLVLALAYLLMMGLLFLVTPYLQGVGAAAGLATGVRLLPLVGALLVGAAAGERLAARAGPRPSAVAGAVVLTAGLLVFATVGTATAAPRVTVGLVAVGVGLGGTLAGAMRAATAMAAHDPLGMIRWTTAVRQVAGAIGVVVFGTALTILHRAAVPELPRGVAVHATDPAHAHLRAAARLAYVDGLHAAALIGAALALLTAGLAATGRFGAAGEAQAAAAPATVGGERAR